MTELNAELIGRIRITSTPDGEAPLEIREKWIGIEMPCLYYDGHAHASGVVSKKYRGAQASYVVFQKDAIDALAHVHPEAAQWWNSVGYPTHEEARRLFNAESISVVKEVLSLAQITGAVN